MGGQPKAGGCSRACALALAVHVRMRAWAEGVVTVSTAECATEAGGQREETISRQGKAC